MSIGKIEGYASYDEGIRLYVSKTNRYVSVDAEITPLFCMKCNTQLAGQFGINGSRYGSVGTVQCDTCQAEISCVDSDAFPREKMTTYTIFRNQSSVLTFDYPALYLLKQGIWTRIRKKTGYDIYDIHDTHDVSLNTVIKEICRETGTKVVLLQKTKDAFAKKTSSYISEYPRIIYKWFLLLQKLGITS